MVVAMYLARYIHILYEEYCKVKRLARIGLTFVGTIRSNKICIANEMRKDRSRPVLSSLFGLHENLVSIFSYVLKKKMWEPTFDCSLYETLWRGSNETQSNFVLQ